MHIHIHGYTAGNTAGPPQERTIHAPTINKDVVGLLEVICGNITYYEMLPCVLLYHLAKYFFVVSNLQIEILSYKARIKIQLTINLSLSA